MDVEDESEASQEKEEPERKGVAEILELYRAKEEKVKALSHALQGRDEQLARVQQASEKALEEYDDLQSKYDASTQVINTAVQQASKLYHENKKLKRQSAKMMMKFQEFCPDNIVIQLEELSCESPSAEKADTNDYVNDLKGRLAEEQTLKEQLRNVQEQLNEECIQHSKTKEKLAQQTELLERLQNASVMAVEDYDQMRQDLVEKCTIAEKAMNDIREVQKERNVLVRTSAILMGNISADHKLLEALMEVERLTLALETAEIERDKLVESESEFRKTAEKLQVRLDCIILECNKLEEKEKRKSERINQLENQVTDLQKKIQNKANPPPPPPLPPPPPPPQPQAWNPFGALMSAIGLSKRTKKPIGAVPNEDKTKKAMDEIIEKIEKGTFRLRPTQANPMVGDSLDSVKDQGIQEMRNVLSTLRKGTSMREPRRIAEAPQLNFGYSLRLKPRQNSAEMMPEKEAPPELANVLLRRRLAVDTHSENPKGALQSKNSNDSSVTNYKDNTESNNSGSSARQEMQNGSKNGSGLLINGSLSK